MNINKNSLPEGGLYIVEVSNLRNSSVLGSLEIPVLSDINLKIEKEEFLAIMGPSGSEKSTLVNLIGCLDRPTEGHVLVRGRDFNRMSDKELASLRGLDIGFVFQTFNLVPRLTAFENGLIPTFDSLRTRIDLKRHARELLEVTGLRHRIHHRLGELLAGESQRVSIARALINDPAILLEDEPTGNLDSRTGAEILQTFMDLNMDGRAEVINTHEPKIVKYADRVIQVKDGIIEYN